MKKIFSFTLAIIMTISILIPYALAENNQKSVDEQENDTFKQKYFSIRTDKENSQYSYYDFETGEKFYYSFEIDEESTFITPSNENDIAPASQRDTTTGIIGTDDRSQVTSTTVSPYKSIVYIQVTWGNNHPITQSTGFLIDDKIVATAAHCIYKADLGGYPSSIKVIPGKNGSWLGSNPYGSSASSGASVPTYYENNASSGYDYGLIYLKKDMSSAGHFDLLSSTPSELVDEEVTITGYPDNTHQYTMDGTICGYSGNNIYTQIDVTGGQSGSPIYNSDYDVVGICTNSGATQNTGKCITGPMYNWYMYAVNNY